MSRSLRAGLIVLGVPSALDLALPLFTDGEHPPMAVALVAAGLGLASLALVVSAWRGTTRAVMPLVILRVVSALSAVPALTMSGVPNAAVRAAAAIIALTVVGGIAVLAGTRRHSVAAACEHRACR
ncbi:MAG: hypothetical protein M3325_07085 [Actinomycetota bacterium]|nr:hypothetical protein [Actinomycetota bacterium]